MATAGSLYTYFHSPGALGLNAACAVISIAVICAMICTPAGKSHPANLILLFIFTICESITVTGFTCNPWRFPPHTVMLAGFVTAMTTIAVTMYACYTKTDFSIFVGVLFIFVLAMLPVLILGFIVRTKMMHLVICAFGVLLYGLFLLIDTMIIIGKTGDPDEKIDEGEYCIAALMLYLDIIMMFLYILELFGGE